MSIGKDYSSHLYLTLPLLEPPVSRASIAWYTNSVTYIYSEVTRLLKYVLPFTCFTCFYGYYSLLLMFLWLLYVLHF